MRVGYAVVGHHSRTEAAEQLAKELSTFLALDDGTLGSLANHDRAWHALSTQEVDWCVVVQDDAVLVADFPTHVEQALAHLPTSEAAVSFYTGTTRPKPLRVKYALRRAVHEQAAWLRDGAALWGPALALPAGHVEPMLQYVQGIEMPYDQRFSRYLWRAGMSCYYTVPSLVDHADGPSLLNNGRVPRRARLFGVPERWNSDVINI